MKKRMDNEICGRCRPDLDAAGRRRHHRSRALDHAARRARCRETMIGAATGRRTPSTPTPANDQNGCEVCVICTALDTDLQITFTDEGRADRGAVFARLDDDSPLAATMFVAAVAGSAGGARGTQPGAHPHSRLRSARPQNAPSCGRPPFQGLQRRGCTVPERCSRQRLTRATTPVMADTCQLDDNASFSYTPHGVVRCSLRLASVGPPPPPSSSVRSSAAGATARRGGE